MKRNFTFGILALSLVAIGAAGACAGSNKNVSDDSGDSPDYASTKGDSKDDASNEETQKKSSKNAGGSSSEKEGAGSSSAEPPKATGPVAHVNGEPISAKAFNEEIQKVAKTGKIPPGLLSQFSGRLIDKLIDRRLVDQAIKESKVKVSKKEVDKKLNKVRSRFDKAAKKRGKDASLSKVAQKYGISDDELRDSVRRSIAIEKLLKKQGMEVASQKEVEKYYEKNKDKFTRPEQVRARHILVKVPDDAGEEKWKKAEKRIQKIREKVQTDGTSFAKMAREKSEGPAAPKGGDLGYISRERFPASFTETAFKLDKNEISKPVRTKHGWHIIKLVDHRKAKTVPYEKVKQRLAERVKNKRIKKHLQKFIDKRRKSAEIEKHPDNIE